MEELKLWASLTLGLFILFIILMLIVFAPQTVSRTFPSLEVGSPYSQSQGYWIGVMVGVVGTSMLLSSMRVGQIQKKISNTIVLPLE